MRKGRSRPLFTPWPLLKVRKPGLWVTSGVTVRRVQPIPPSDFSSASLVSSRFVHDDPRSSALAHGPESSRYAAVMLGRGLLLHRIQQFGCLTRPCLCPPRIRILFAPSYPFNARATLAALFLPSPASSRSKLRKGQAHLCLVTETLSTAGPSAADCSTTCLVLLSALS